MDRGELAGAAAGTRGFVSDNCSGIHPEVLAAIAGANAGHQPSYGDDEVTRRLQEIFRRHFGSMALGYPVLTGTGANVVALRAMTGRWGAVLCSADAHINTDEGGAPEQLAGLKLDAVPAPGGKLRPEQIAAFAEAAGEVHWAQPEVVSLTQPTEWGVVYSVDELARLCAAAHERGLLVHMDGARLCNAAAALDLRLRAITTDVGVDVVSFGGTKIGLMLGEAVVILNPAAVPGAEFARKSTTQLASKMRFISAQFEALLGDDLWRRIASHGNRMARLMEAGLRSAAGVEILHEVDTNAVFAAMPPAVVDRLRGRFPLQISGPAVGLVRLMMSFDTTEQDVEDFVRAVYQEAPPG
jgi:threonine aldolase